MVNQRSKSSTSLQRQSSILEFTTVSKGIRGVILDTPETEATIDLTSDAEVESKSGLSTDDITTEVKLDEIFCPICNNNISFLFIQNRIQHVEECLTINSLNDSEDFLKTTSATESEGGPVKSKKRKANYVAPYLKDKMKYINKKRKSSPVDTNDRPIKPPYASNKGRSKPDIPKVKIISFASSQNSSYEIAVDAFQYSSQSPIEKYFLSHFHSDHYGGISKKWCYERVFSSVKDINDNYRRIIYCTDITGKLLTLKFSVDPRFIKVLDLNTRYKIKSFEGEEVIDGGIKDDEFSPGVYVTAMNANHCPGSSIFLFESYSVDGQTFRALHCGDFRVNEEILYHPILSKFRIDNKNERDVLNEVYLDTTYMSPDYNFAKQDVVCDTIADMLFQVANSSKDVSLASKLFGNVKQLCITDFVSNRNDKKKLLILVGTYLIGKEKLAITISKRLNCPIYASSVASRDDKAKILKLYGNDYLNDVLSDTDVVEDSQCIVHLVPMKMVSNIKELTNYVNHNKYNEQFKKCIGLRPTGWSFNTSKSHFSSQYNDKSVHTLKDTVRIMSEKPKFTIENDILSQDTKKKKDNPIPYKIYALPYSEHSSFRELMFFVIFFKVRNIIPTVNIHNEYSKRQMDSILSIWNYVRWLKMGAIKNVKDSDITNKILNLCLDDF